MNVFPTVYPGRSRMVGLLAMVVALAALVTSIVLALAVSGGARAEVGAARAGASPTSAELQAVRDYHAVGMWGSLTPEQVRSIGTYLFGVSNPTPAQLQAIRDFHAFGTWGSLTPAEVRSIRAYLFGAAGK